METLAMIRQAFKEESRTCTYEKVQTQWGQKGKTGEEKVKSMFIIFFHIKETVHKKNLSCQTKQSSPHTTVMFYGDCVKMCEDFTPNFSDKRITTTHHPTLPFSSGNF
jgi:hypothetical protein